MLGLRVVRSSYRCWLGDTGFARDAARHTAIVATGSYGRRPGCPQLSRPIPASHLFQPRLNSCPAHSTSGNP